ncbi:MULTISPECIES: 5-deoxy-glucuronate isomerase [unclassified Frankia]|uniref:5-deoxy-glucuronate isomerase n=1 Tax=unclassified Frankia TaxID=2632575 RepID=UPI002AD2DC87|nr:MULTISPECIES: 5-deoxy-glucuronate isomerase [unclassified Frankia]
MSTGAGGRGDGGGWHIPAGTLGDGDWRLDLGPKRAGWEFSGLRVLWLEPGESRTFGTDDRETIVLPLSGSCEVEHGGTRWELAGRGDVFDGPTDFVYLPRDAVATVRSRQGGRFAFPSAVARRALPARYVSAADVPVELRGADSCSRQVNNFCTPESFDADRLIACEVLTPAGNWSSYPPHKHDEQRPGETELEEIYYFEVAAGPAGPGAGYQRVYGTPRRPADLLAEVRSGDVVIIPHGWHGPAMAAPGYDLYYLNVMAGPGPERAWLICDDPAHAWVRRTWGVADIDPRLPMTPTGRGRLL